MVESPGTQDRAEAPFRFGRGKRKQVIDAAVELFLMNGYDQTSMDGIAARAGVSKTTVYAHYADKLALFKAVVERAAQTLAIQHKERKVSANASVEERLTHLITAVIEATLQPDFRSFLRIMISESARHPDLAEIMRTPARVDVAGRIADLLVEEATSQGRTLADPLSDATFLLRMGSAGPQLDSLLFPKFEPSRAQLEAHTRQVVGIFLRGMAFGAGEQAKKRASAQYPYPWISEDGA